MIVNKKRPSTPSDVMNANGRVVSGWTDNCAGHWWYIAGEGAGIGAGDATSSSLRSDFRMDRWMTSSPLSFGLYSSLLKVNHRLIVFVPTQDGGSDVDVRPDRSAYNERLTDSKEAHNQEATNVKRTISGTGSITGDGMLY